VPPIESNTLRRLAPSCAACSPITSSVRIMLAY
jgi:hypothetical protein